MFAHISKSSPRGTMPVPPSKSMAHRIIICAALADKTSSIQNLHYSEDILATLGAMQLLGATVQQGEDSAVIGGTGGRLTPPPGPVYCRESGSTLRFLIPVLALLNTPVTLTGAARLFARPLTAYHTIFKEQGLQFAVKEDSVTLQGPLKPGKFTLAGNVSSQFISGLLFALPLLTQDSTLHITPPFESRSYVELTRAAQKLFGVASHWQNACTLHIPGGQQYRAGRHTIEGDWSQAVVPAVLGAVLGGVRVSGLSADSPQGDRAFLNVLSNSGANVQWQNDTLHITPPAPGLISPGIVDLADCPDLGPVLCSFALFCKGETRFINAARLRIKESDRIACVQAELCKMGGRITSDENSITIQGGFPLHAPAENIASHNDHRIVMAAAVAALCGGVPATIAGAQAVNKSWPFFFKNLENLNVKVDLYD